MTAKEYLKQYNQIVYEIMLTTASIDELTDRATSITASTDGERVQTSSSPDKLGGLVASIADLKTKRFHQNQKAIKMLSRIEKTIKQVPDTRLQLILQLHYIRRMTWGDIAQQIGFKNERHVHRLHAQALEEVEKIINK